MLIRRAQLRHEARVKADMVEAVAWGYGGARGGKNGKGTRAMQQLLEALRTG